MTARKKPKPARIVLLVPSHGVVPGEVVEVDAETAERLVSQGMAREARKDEA